MALPRIFVSIACWRDPECQHTVRDLFAKAAHPGRISVGICWQYDPENDHDCFVAPPPFPDQVRTQMHLARDSKGGCWARAQALSLRQDEDYILQIDAHMRFAQDWDETLLSVLARSPSQRAVVSTSLPAYHPPDALQDCTGCVPIARATMLGKPGDLQPLHIGGYIRKRERLRGEGPILSAFFVGHFMFAPSAAVGEVPFDPHIYFRGQELTYSARLWTHGWDIYQPDSVVMYHYWASKTRTSGENHYKTANEQALLAQERVWHLLGIVPAARAEALRDIDAYGMGKARTLDDYWRFAGIDLRTGTIGEKARLGYWEP